MRHACRFAGPRHTSPAAALEGRQPDNAYDRLFPLGRAAQAWRGLNGDPAVTDAALSAIAEARRGSTDEPPDDKDGVPAGYSYLGQLLVHDLSFSRIGRRVGRFATGMSLANLRSPRLDLDCLYGDGPDVDPQLYERPTREQDARHRFRLAPARDADLIDGKPAAFDLPRITERGPDGKPVTIDAVIADVRNDIHLILAQLAILFMRLHNRVADLALADPRVASRLLGRPAGSTEDAFTAAQRFVLASYRAIIVEDYLGRILDPHVHEEVLGPAVAAPADPEENEPVRLPIEFALAGARIGHAMSRNIYRINDQFPAQLQRELLSFSGFSAKPDLPVPAKWRIDWSNFFELADRKPQFARRITPFYAPSFIDRKFLVPVVPPGGGQPRDELRSLALLDLQRCQKEVPSGQACAEAVRSQLAACRELEVLRGERMLPSAFTHRHAWMGERLKQTLLTQYPDFLESTPLSYYVLQEAAVLGDNGLRLGPLGSYILATTVRRALERAYAEERAAGHPAGDPAGPAVRTMPDLIRLIGATDPALAGVILG